MILWDLDSSRRLDEVDPRFRWLEVVRDLCSCMHKIYHRLFPLVAARHISVDEFCAAGIESSLLSSYFDVQANQVVRVVTLMRSAMLGDLRLAESTGRSIPEADRNVSRLDLYGLMYCAVFDLYRATRLGQQYAPHGTKSDLVQMLRDACGSWENLEKNLTANGFLPACC